jgi:hypothetical protein
VTGDPVMLFISGSHFGWPGPGILQVKVHESASPYTEVDTFKISFYHNSYGYHRAFAPINRKMKNLVRGKSYFIQISVFTNCVIDLNDPFHIVVTQYNNQ